jgi:hypothetical protein
MGAYRDDERLMCAVGLSNSAPVRFESCESVAYGGVMLLLPFLFESGLMSYGKHYSPRKSGYYTFDNLIIIIAIMFLCRIKNFEQIKHYSPGELGKLVGSDRVPEVSKLRGMFKELTDQKCADKWASSLARQWIGDDNPELYYIDGHVQVYHGRLANLGKKHVSRQRLCLPGTMDFWVNASDGNPYFYVTADVNEKMNEMLTEEIIPQLLHLHPVCEEHKRRMEADSDVPLFTLVFDREGYSPEFFHNLWEKHRIAIITDRKNAKDHWDEALFEDVAVPTTFEDEQMKLHEKEFISTDGKYKMREVRRLCKDGHQTSIVTTNRILSIIMIASYMFARWAQEIFFGYMRQEYAFDKMIRHAVNELDKNTKVVNPAYNNSTYIIKKEREKLNRLKAKIYEHEENDPPTEDEVKEYKKWMKKKLELLEKINQMDNQIKLLTVQRKDIPRTISVSQMPEAIRYNQLDNESRTLTKIIKMICYKAETAFARLLKPHYKRAEDEIRALVKTIIRTPVNIEVNEEKKELLVTLFPLSNQRSNNAVQKICDTVNQTETVYPGTDLKLMFKIATTDFVPD